MEFTRPRGTRDFLFDEMRERKKAESILRNVFENYAYQEIKTPLFEELKLFTTKSSFLWSFISKTASVIIKFDRFGCSFLKLI